MSSVVWRKKKKTHVEIGYKVNFAFQTILKHVEIGYNVYFSFQTILKHVAISYNV